MCVCVCVRAYACKFLNEFEIGPHSVAQVNLKLGMPCFGLPNVEIPSVAPLHLD